MNDIFTIQKKNIVSYTSEKNKEGEMTKIRDISVITNVIYRIEFHRGRVFIARLIIEIHSPFCMTIQI